MKGYILGALLASVSFGVAAAPSTMTDTEMGETVAGADPIQYFLVAGNPYNAYVFLPDSEAAQAGLGRADVMTDGATLQTGHITLQPVLPY